MYQEPEQSAENSHFFFEADQDLETVCNAPADKDGVFQVHELRKGKVSLVYIGYSTEGGLFNEIVNGLHFDKNPRKLGWTYQLIKDQTDALDVYWSVTDPAKSNKKVCTDMLKEYLGFTGKLPKWNK